MVFEDAGPAEIVRLSQKDEHFLTQLRSEVTSLLQKVKGIRWWILWHKELEFASDICYFGLTTLLGNQTLGEEYVNVIQVDVTKRRIPHSWVQKRLLMILLHVGGPYATERWAERIRRNLASRPDFLSRNPRLRSFLENSLPNLSQAISILHRCHLLLFYFQVKYYHFSKRLTATRYVLIRPWLEDGLSRWGYWILGLLSLVQLLLSTAVYVYSYWSCKMGSSSQYEQSTGHRSKSELPSTDSRKTCPLCLETLSSPTATPCGHVFCWDCILRCLQMKQQCPLCSEKFVPSRLIYLRNYNE